MHGMHKGAAAERRRHEEAPHRGAACCWHCVQHNRWQFCRDQQYTKCRTSHGPKCQLAAAAAGGLQVCLSHWATLLSLLAAAQGATVTGKKVPGLAVLNAAVVTISNSSFADNKAVDSESGAAILATDKATVTIPASTFARNAAM